MDQQQPQQQQLHTPRFNDRIKQILLLILIIFLVFISVQQLTAFMPGVLGAVTLYILSRANYFQLVYNKKWKRGKAAGLYLLYYLVLLGLPVYLAITLVSPKLNDFFSDPTATIENLKGAVMNVQEKLGLRLFSQTQLQNGLNKATAYLPTLINSTFNLLTNLITMLFFLYYMLINGSEIEKTLFRIIPLKDANTTMLASETKKIVKANALGIPLISIIQGLTATLGYFIFGIDEWGLWGFLTGVFAFFPIVGTMIVWVPLVLYTFVSGDSTNGILLLLYCTIVVGNIDYIARITIMRKIGNVHPVLTVLGVLIGLGLFGFIGLIFGPLLVNYIIVLFKIYMNEFVEPMAKEQDVTENVQEIAEQVPPKETGTPSK